MAERSRKIAPVEGVPRRVREHVALMSRFAIGLSGAGGVLGVYGVFQLIQADDRNAWFWLFLGALVLFVAQVQAVQHALSQRDEARKRVSEQEEQLAALLRSQYTT